MTIFDKTTFRISAPHYKSVHCCSSRAWLAKKQKRGANAQKQQESYREMQCDAEVSSRDNWTQAKQSRSANSPTLIFRQSTVITGVVVAWPSRSDDWWMPPVLTTCQARLQGIAVRPITVHSDHRSACRSRFQDLRISCVDKTRKQDTADFLEDWFTGCMQYYSFLGHIACTRFIDVVYSNICRT